MPLQYTGMKVPNPNGGVSFRCTDQGGKTVAVHASDEVVHDFGELAVLKKGSDKFDAGSINDNVVTVYTTDF
jgi:hypothetical protein